MFKPAPATPLSSELLGELLAQTDLPDGAWSVLPVAAQLVHDPHLPVVSFTGSGPVGWGIRDAVPRKHVTLELGGNVAVVVAKDFDDLAWALQRIATFAMVQAGQPCVSVQRVLCAAERYDELRQRILEQVRSPRTRDPADPADPLTDVGPLINLAAAERVQSWCRRPSTPAPACCAAASAKAAAMPRRSLKASRLVAACSTTRYVGPCWCCNASRRSKKRSCW